MPPAKAAAASPEALRKTLAEALAGLYQQGLAHLKAGRLAPAETVFRAIVQAIPEHADSLHLLGLCHYEQGADGEAIELISRAIQLAPERADFAGNLGNALQRAGRIQEAEACYRGAIALRPEGPLAYSNLSAALREQGRLEEAVAAARRALELRPDYADAHNGLATALADLGRFEEAAAAYREAVRLKPQGVEARNNLANVLGHLGDLEGALAAYREVLALKPDEPEIRHNFGMALLAQGRWAEGWAEYEHRFGTRHLKRHRREVPQPLWEGGALQGRTLLVHAEQGFGDTLQFCRYLARLKPGGRVVLEVQPALKRLLAGLPGATQVVAKGEPTPAFDVHAPLLSLPRLIQPDPEAFRHAPPYLAADSGAAARWRKRLGPGLKVGLVWAGGERPNQPTLQAVNRRRSLALADLAPLAAVPGVQFVSLQKGAPAAQAAAPPPGMRLADPTDELADFADTAALVQALDLVIGVDTAVIHLAGALGKPTWLLNRFDSCWRWGREATDSVWYPTLRQFRQAAPGDWSGPVAEIAATLRRFAELA